MTEKTDWGATEEIPMSKKEADELFALIESLRAKGEYGEAIQLLEKGLQGPFALVGEDYTKAETMVREMEYKQALWEANEVKRK
ncbi:hypothetical protein KKG29_03515 [Patescibacteria group bacterium]|nr:hypothetical protein [Patescibacteria group bacterium]MBU4000211.1 hypothetical protein [Patescibacteria group bacterium]MBU4056621.1 hypothetical protein [Patescibacteria group bacterium]MBU4368648.1 hypothetical protein [Patescibacteria group bacterium]